MVLGAGDTDGPFQITGVGGNKLTDSEKIDAFKTDNKVWNRLLEGNKTIEEKLDSNPTGEEFFETVQDVNDSVEEDTGLDINPTPSEPVTPGIDWSKGDVDVNLGLPDFNAKGFVNSGPSMSDLTDQAGQTANDFFNIPDSPMDVVNNVVPGMESNGKSVVNLGLTEKIIIGGIAAVTLPELVKTIGGNE